MPHRWEFRIEDDPNDPHYVNLRYRRSDSSGIMPPGFSLWDSWTKDMLEAFFPAQIDYRRGKLRGS